MEYLGGVPMATVWSQSVPRGATHAPAWERQLVAACEALGAASPDVLRSLSVVLHVEALAEAREVARCAAELADEHGLAILAELSGHSLSVWYSREAREDTVER